MKYKSKIVLTAIGILTFIGITTAAIACDGDHERGKHRHGGAEVERHLERMKDHLNLTDQQTLQISAIFKAQKNAKSDHHSQRKAMHQAMMKLDPSAPDYEQQVEKLAREQAETMIQKIREDAHTRKQIHDILTPEQQQKAEEMHEKQMERHKDRHGSDHWG